MHTTVTVTQFKSASKHTSGSHAMICQQTRIRGEYLKTPDVMFWWKESSCTHAARGNSTVRAGGHTPALRECVSNEFSSLILRSVSGVQRRHEKAKKKLEGNILQGLSRNALVSGCTAQRFMEAKKCPSATALGGGGALESLHAGTLSKLAAQRMCILFWHSVPLCWRYVVRASRSRGEVFLSAQRGSRGARTHQRLLGVHAGVTCQS